MSVYTTVVTGCLPLAHLGTTSTETLYTGQSLHSTTATWCKISDATVKSLHTLCCQNISPQKLQATLSSATTQARTIDQALRDNHLPQEWKEGCTWEESRGETTAATHLNDADELSLIIKPQINVNLLASNIQFA